MQARAGALQNIFLPHWLARWSRRCLQPRESPAKPGATSRMELAVSVGGPLRSKYPNSCYYVNLKLIYSQKAAQPSHPFKKVSTL